MNLSRYFAVIAVAGVASAAWAVDAPRLSVAVEAVAPPEALAEPVRKSLSGDALVVKTEKGFALLTVWFRADLPLRATAEQVANGLTYREIPPGTLVGAVRFPAPFTDFRKQRLPAGVYTLRFAVQPETGDHMGTSPHPEFCLLTAAAKDADAAQVEVKELVERSSEVTGGTHPAVLLLFPYHAKDAGPKLADKGNGVWVANLRRAVTVGDTKATLGFGVTVAGTTAE